METTKKLSLDDIFGKASAPASSEAVKSIDDIFGQKEATTPVTPYGTMTDEIRGVSYAPADLIGVSPQPAIIGENELQKNRAGFEKELKSTAGAIQPTQDGFKPMSADAFKVGGDVTMPGDIDKPKSLSQTVQSEINKRWGGDLQSIIDKTRSVNPENVNLAEDMESHFLEVMKDKVPSDSFITQEDLDGFKFTRDYSNGDKDIEYSFGHYTYPQEVVNEYVARHNDEVLHNMRFKEEPEYRNEWFLRNVGVTEQAYRDEVAADLENRLHELRKKVVATLPAQHTRSGYAAIGAAANKPSSGGSVSIQKIDKALKTVNTLRKNSFGAGLKEGFDLADILTLGVSGIGENVALLNALNKSASGKTLSTSEQALVEAWDIQNEAEEVMQVLGGRSLASNIGRGGAQSLGFITQTVGTGGLASAATKGITRAAAKSALKRVASSGVASKIQEGVRYGSLKAAESLVGAAARTPFMGFTYRNYTDKRLNQFQINERVDEATGEISKYIDKQKSSVLRDAAHAALESYFESQSEDVGGLIDFGITSFARALPIKQFIRSSVVNGMTGTVKNGAMKWIKESAKIYGLAGEVLSEAYGDAAVNLLTSNTDGWKKMASSEYWWELLGVSSMLSGGFGVVNRAVNSYSGRNLDRQIAHEDNNRRNALSRIEDDMLKKELTEVSLTDDLIERSKMLSSLDWSNFTKEDMANTIDFISAQTRLDVMRESDMESRRLARIMPAIDEVKTLADNGALDDDQAAATLATIYSDLFRTQEHQRTLNILTDRIKVAADAGISADEINEILRGAGLTVFNPGDEIETLTGDRAIIDKVLPGAYEVVNNEGDRAVVSFEEVLQNTPEVRQIQQESNQTEGQTESVSEINPQVEQAVESARQEAEVIKNLDDDVIYEATLSDGTPVNIIKGANIVYNNQTGEVDYDASDATVVVRSNDGSKRQISIRDIDSIDQAMSVDEALEVATAAATEVVNSQEQAETPTAEIVSTRDEVPSAQEAEAATVEQSSESPANQPEEQPQIPLLKNGEPDYNAMDARMFAEQYVTRFGEGATERIARNNIKASNKTISTIEKQIEDVTDPNKMPALYSRLQDAQATKDKYSAVLEELGLSADESEDNAARIQRKKQENTPWFNKLFPDGFPNVESVILWDIANGNRIRWTNKEVNGAVVSKGLGSHLGLADSNAERTRRVALIGKNAPTPEEYAEQLPERLNAMGIRFEESELLDKVLDVYASVDTVRKAKEELEGISADIQAEQEGLDYEEEQMRRNYEREQESLRQDLQAEVEAAQTEQEQPTNEETQEEELSIEDEVPFMVSSDSVQTTNEAQQLATEAVITALEDAGVEVVEATPEMVEEALRRRDVQWQAVEDRLTALKKAEKFVEESLQGKKRNRSFRLTLPASTIKKIRASIGRDFDSHNLDGNSFVHSKRLHGINGEKIDANSIPLSDKDFALAPYIMIAPDRVVKGSNGAVGRESIRFEKTLSNGVVVVVEKEQKNSPTDMDTITMWADLSGSVMHGQSPASTIVRDVIATMDDAKIRKDAENTIRQDVQMHIEQQNSIDAAYMDAVETGDIERAKALVREYAESRGYYLFGEFRDAHAAPSSTVDKPDFTNADLINEKSLDEGWDVNLYSLPQGENLAPNDFWSPMGPRWYMYNNKAGMEAHSAIAPAIRSIQYQIEAYGEVRDMPSVKVYRAVPNSVVVNSLENGDWVTPSLTYANTHGLARFGESEYRIIEQEVPATDLWWDGNDAREWGYDNGNVEADANTTNHIKSLDPITYDDAGNMIPLSARFDASTADSRFSIGPAPVFVSNAKIAVLGIKQEKATPEQWLKMIEKNGGLKAGEDKWVGLSDWLKASDKKTLTKQEVLDYINENQIQIEETTYSSNSAVETTPEFKALQEEFKQIAKGYEDEARRNLDEYETKLAKKYNFPENYFDTTVLNSDETKAHSSLWRAVDEAYNAAWVDLVDKYGDDFEIAFWRGYDGIRVDNAEAAGVLLGLPIDRPIYHIREDYTTKGLEGNREIALTVPTIEPWNENDKVHFGDAGEGRAIAWVRFGETTALTNEAIAAKKDVEDYLASMREKYGSKEGEKTDAMTADEISHLQSLTAKEIESREKGLRVLVIDEIQSKRHQKGREKGYRTKEQSFNVQEAEQNLRSAVKEFNDYRDQLKRKYDYESLGGSIVERSRNFMAALSEGERNEFKRLNEQKANLERALQAHREVEIGIDDITFTEHDGVIDASYGDYISTHVAGTAPAMMLQTLREQIRQDRIDNARRFDQLIPDAPFEKNWAELAMKRMLRYAAENGYDAIAWTKGDQQAERYDIGSVVEKVVSYTEDGAKTVRIYLKNNEPLNLKVDSEGKILYSNRLTVSAGQNLSDVVGKDVAVKILRGDGEDATIYAGKGKEYAAKQLLGEGLRVGASGMKAFYDQMLPAFMNKYGKKWGVKVQDVTLPNVEEAGRTMHSVDVTESMRESVMQGQPMFYRRPNGTVYGWTNGTTVYLTESGMNPNTSIHEYTHIWADAMRKHNPEGWKSILKLLKGTPVWNEVMADGNYNNIHGNKNQVASETLSRLSGRQNGAKVEEMAKQLLEENANDTVKKNRVRKLIERMREAVKKFWNWVGVELFGIKEFESVEQIADRVLYDLVSGTDLGTATGRGEMMRQSQERAEIERAAKVNGTWLKAPNGKDTNLTPEQWVTVRTKAFKRWFGDWEKAARIEKLRTSESASIVGNEIESSDDMKQYRKNVLEYGKSLRGEYRNADTGHTIIINRDSLTEVLHHDGNNVAHIQSIAAIPQMVERGIFITSEPVSADASEKLKNAKEVQYYVCGLNIGGVPYTVKFVVAEYENGERYYDHSLTQIEKGDLLNRAELSSTVADSKSPISGIKDKRLVSILQTNSSKILDANGEPLVVEHSTWNEDFHTFDISKLGESSGDKGIYGSGFYFGNVGETEMYGDRVIRSYLSVKNPFILPEGDMLQFFDYLVDNFDKEGLRDIVVTNSGKSSTMGEVIDAIKEVKANYGRGEYNELIQAMMQYWTPSSAADRVIEQTIFRKVGFAFYRSLTSFIEHNIGQSEFSEALKSAGYDGIVYDNHEYIAFYPNQIKLAEENTTFDPNDDDIRFSIGPSEQQDDDFSLIEHKVTPLARLEEERDALLENRENNPNFEQEYAAIEERIREERETDRVALTIVDGLESEAHRVAVEDAVFDYVREHNLFASQVYVVNSYEAFKEKLMELFTESDIEDLDEHTGAIYEDGIIVIRADAVNSRIRAYDRLIHEYTHALTMDQLYDPEYFRVMLGIAKQVGAEYMVKRLYPNYEKLEIEKSDDGLVTGLMELLARDMEFVVRNGRFEKFLATESSDESVLREYFDRYNVPKPLTNLLIEIANKIKANKYEQINGERNYSHQRLLSATSLEDAGANLQPDAGVDGRGLPLRRGLFQSQEGVTADAGGQVGGGTRADRADLAEPNQTAKSDSRARLIAELRQKLRDVKAETRTVAAEVGKIVRKAITTELIDKMGKRTFDNIVRTIETATVRRDVEYAVNRIEEAVLDMELRDKQDKFDKYLNFRVQGESARGVSIAANVTDQVRQFITIIRDNLDRPASEVEALIEERGGSLAERTGLQVLGFYQDARNFEREVQEIEGEIEKIKSENTELRKKRAALNKAGKTNDAKNLSDQINANKETIEHLNSERISTKRSQLYYIDMAANELEREIAYGKEGHKEWLQQEAERKQELIKIAWNDIRDGKKIPILDEQEPIWKKTKNAVVDFLLAPAYSWDYLLKMISVNAPNGEGALYDHFMRSENGYVAASGNYYQAYEDFKARLNEKAKDIFGKDYKQVLKDSNQPLDVTIQISAQYAKLQSTTDENKIREGASEIYTPTIGEVVYAYMAAKMPDGRVKLDKMGVKEDVIDYLVRQIPQGYITFADWVQNEFLPERRKVYNKTHLEVFGTQMAQIENYVPLMVKKDFVYEEFDGSKIDKAELPSSITGSIIKRKRNSLPIDLHTNIFDLLLDHGQQMEHWNAYTRIVRDTNQFLSNTQIRRALDYRKMGLHRKLKEAALIASNSYQPDVDRLEKMTVALSKMAASSKIAFRINTAIKQVLSYPAFYAYVVDAHFWWYLTRNISPDTWGRNFRWALDNIPSFQERWLGRMAGDDRLAQMTSPQLDRWIKGMGNVGMLPNALVDAVTCANGAQAVYRYEHERYLKIGLDEPEADRLAKIAAAQALNQTQQSSEGMYLSRIQADRTAFAVAISTFQNSNFAYLRKELEGIDQLMRDTKKQIANREKYYEQQGVNLDQAAKLALQDVASANRTAVAKILVFGFILSTIWTLGNSVWKYAFGDEDAEDKWEDAAIRGFFNSFTRNLSVGQYVETVAWSDFRELNPSLLLSDLNMFIERLESIAEGNVKMWDRTAAWTVLSTLSSLGLGVDINSFASMCEGVQGAIDNGANVEDIMLLVNAPRSQAKFIAGPPKEGETLDEYTKRQAWIERKIMSRIDKKQLDKWSRNYEAYKQAEMLGVPYSRDKMGRVSVPYITEIDDSYSALLKSVGRTKSGAKRNDGDLIADDVKTRIRDFSLIKRIKDINALEKNLDAMVILDGAYPELLKELCEAKQQLIEEWNQ